MDAVCLFFGAHRSQRQHGQSKMSRSGVGVGGGGSGSGSRSSSAGGGGGGKSPNAVRSDRLLQNKKLQAIGEGGGGRGGAVLQYTRGNGY